MTTGVASLNEDLTPKLLDYQRMILPQARTIAAIFNPANPSNVRALEDLRARAIGMAMTVSSFALKVPQELNDVFAAVALEKPDSLHVIGDSGTADLSDRVASLALSQRLPSFSALTTYAELGGLLAYGAARRQNLIKAGYYVRKILDCASPGELPVEQPTQIELWINLKTAKALGLAYPLVFNS
jgi:putative ABC transport system substrate-binding protein